MPGAAFSVAMVEVSGVLVSVSGAVLDDSADTMVVADAVTAAVPVLAAAPILGVVMEGVERGGGAGVVVPRSVGVVVMAGAVPVSTVVADIIVVVAVTGVPVTTMVAVSAVVAVAGGVVVSATVAVMVAVGDASSCAVGVDRAVGGALCTPVFGPAALALMARRSGQQ